MASRLPLPWLGNMGVVGARDRRGPAARAGEFAPPCWPRPGAGRPSVPPGPFRPRPAPPRPEADRPAPVARPDPVARPEEGKGGRRGRRRLEGPAAPPPRLRGAADNNKPTRASPRQREPRRPQSSRPKECRGVRAADCRRRRRRPPRTAKLRLAVAPTPRLLLVVALLLGTRDRDSPAPVPHADREVHVVLAAVSTPGARAGPPTAAGGLGPTPRLPQTATAPAPEVGRGGRTGAAR